MFLFIDFTFHPIIELVLPSAYIAEQRNGYCVFYKKASDEVLRSLPNWELSSAEKEALSIINSLQPNELYQKYLKKVILSLKYTKTHKIRSIFRSK